MSNYTFTDEYGENFNLDDCYNSYTAGTTTPNIGIQNSTTDIINRYNKLGATSNLKYNKNNNYQYNSNPLNNIFECKLIASGSNYEMTPITNGCLIKVTNSTTLVFKRFVKGITFILAGGGGGGGGTANSGLDFNGGGGGGAGEVLTSTTSQEPIISIAVNIGSGGSGGGFQQSGSAGGDTTIITNGLTYGVKGGGGGGFGKASGNSGGSGGGGGSWSNTRTNGGAAVNYSNISGTPTGSVNTGGRGEKQDNDTGGGGGGGGAGEVGTSGVGTSNTPYKGGNGITTNNITLGGGGGGGGRGASNGRTPGGQGGNGGGGAGGSFNGVVGILPISGTANTGGGGGGGVNSQNTGDDSGNKQNGASGGSGVCYLLILNSNLINTPLPLFISGCSLWLDANDKSIMSLTSTSVNTWTDKSPNGYIFTAGTNKPTLSENIQNSKSTILFAAASSNYLQGNAASTNFAIGTNSYALFAVFKITSGNGGIYSKSKFSAGSGRILLVRDNGLFNFAFTHTDGGFVQPITSPVTTNTYQLLSITINRKTENKDTSYVNGTLLNSYTYPSGDATNYTPTTNVMLIGAYNDEAGTGIRPGYYLEGNIAEIISYTNPYDMSTTIRQVIEGYLAWKWGVTLVDTQHPYRNNAPPSF
jgi:hypothetical protein